MIAPHPNFKAAIDGAGHMLQLQRPFPQTRWQAVDVSANEGMHVYELMNHSISVPMVSEELEHYRLDVQPNLPWADDHFAERVSGAPMNPGKTWEYWPWAKSADGHRAGGGEFNHNYMERYFPKWAGVYVGGPQETAEGWRAAATHYQPDTPAHRGIRYTYGDLFDVVTQLAREPDTRQAVLPVFFPEDTGAVHGGRVPCSIGYQFLYRHGYLHMTYWLRSCEYYRHFRDDIYLTVRLCLWMLEQLRRRESPIDWNKVRPGRFTMHMTSLHLFKNDYFAVFGEAPQ